MPDQVEGGPGDDVLVLDADPRPVAQDGGYAFSILTYRHSAKGVRVSLGDGRRGTARGDGRDTITMQEPVRLVGSPHDDRLDGRPGADEILGGTGNDVVSGLGGDDSLSGDPYQVSGTCPPSATRSSAATATTRSTSTPVPTSCTVTPATTPWSATRRSPASSWATTATTCWRPARHGVRARRRCGHRHGAFVYADDSAGDPASTWVVHSGAADRAGGALGHRDDQSRPSRLPPA